MSYIEWLGKNFIGLFQAGGETFISLVTGIVPMLVVLLTFTYSIVSIIGKERVNKVIQKSSNILILRYTIMPILSVMLLTSPMAFTFGRFLKEEYKPAFYDAAVSFVHPVTGLFPYANAGELFVYLGIANGVIKAGYDQANLAIRYFLCGIVVILLRGFITEKITKYLMKKENIDL